MMTIEAQA